MNYNEFLRVAAAAAGAWLWAAAAPALPFGAVCTLMVMADVISARRLARRLRRKYPGQAPRLRFSSARFSKVISTLMRVYGLLILAAMVDSVVLTASGLLLRFAAGAVCFWQAVSILENEASANGSRWARMLRRVLIDKTERYLDITLDELKGNDNN